MQFRNRDEAGRRLAEELSASWQGGPPLVLALPRGGVPVAGPIARRFSAPLDVLLVKKLGAPENPEFALGAITEDGKTWLNQEELDYLAPSQNEIDETASRALDEMRRQQAAFRVGRPYADVEGRSVILVDDGLATGATMRAAVASVKSRGASEIVVAVPVGSAEAIAMLESVADRVFVSYRPRALRSVGEWYEDFGQVSDDEVIEILGAGRQEVELDLEDVKLEGELSEPVGCRAWVIFAHGSGSSRKSPRNSRVARALNDAGFGTLLFDLLSIDESEDRENVFDVDLLAERLAQATEWLRRRPEHRGLPIAYFGASTGAAAALTASADYETGVFAIVSRGGRPDLAMDALAQVDVPVLLIVGGDDHPVIEMNQRARSRLVRSKIEIIPGATHLFEERGAMERVIDLATRFLANALKGWRAHREAA
jgi:putative phosphoribosyl transferase